MDLINDIPPQLWFLAWTVLLAGIFISTMAVVDCMRACLRELCDLNGKGDMSRAELRDHIADTWDNLSETR